jgi:cytochrome P450
MDRSFDPLDASNGIPYAGLARLRAEEPVYRTPGGAWYIARQEDTLRASEDVHSFVASFREPGVVVPEQEQLVSEIPEPRHGRVRKIVNSAIAYHKLGRVGPMVREMAEDLVAALLERGRGDAVKDLILPIPNAAIGFLLGVPPGDFHLWAQWSDDVVYSEYPLRNRTARGEGLAGAFPEFSAYIDRQIAERRGALSPPEDFVTRLVQTEVDGKRLEDVELRTLIAFLLVSGNETTRHLLGNLMTTFAQRPDLWRALRADPSLVGNAVEESLRMDPPVAVLMRNCARDTEVCGVRIRAGEKVAFGVASANRDERCYDAPDEFRLDRPNPKAHFAFGGGPHVCPGSALARLEGRVLLEVLLERVSELRVAEPDFRRQKVAPFWANGPTRLPLEVSAR